MMELLYLIAGVIIKTLFDMLKSQYDSEVDIKKDYHKSVINLIHNNIQNINNTLNEVMPILKNIALSEETKNDSIDKFSSMKPMFDKLSKLSSMSQKHIANRLFYANLLFETSAENAKLSQPLELNKLSQFLFNYLSFIESQSLYSFNPPKRLKYQKENLASELSRVFLYGSEYEKISNLRIGHERRYNDTEFCILLESLMKISSASDLFQKIYETLFSYNNSAYCVLLLLHLKKVYVPLCLSMNQVGVSPLNDLFFRNNRHLMLVSFRINNTVDLQGGTSYNTIECLYIPVIGNAFVAKVRTVGKDDFENVMYDSYLNTKIKIKPHKYFGFVEKNYIKVQFLYDDCVSLHKNLIHDILTILNTDDRDKIHFS